MRRFALAILALSLAATSVPALAADAGRLLLTGGTSGTDFFNSGTTGNGGLALNFGVAFEIVPQWSIGLSPSLLMAFGGGTSSFQLLMGPLHDFSSDKKNSLYLWPEIGLTNVKGSSVLFAASLGKRFALSEAVSYMPNIAMQLGSGPLIFQLNVVSFAIFL